jgi:hypothetical protein
VLIRLSYNPKVHQVIDIIVVDILEVYGLFFKQGLVGVATRLFHGILVSHVTSKEWQAQQNQGKS